VIEDNAVVLALLPLSRLPNVKSAFDLTGTELIPDRAKMDTNLRRVVIQLDPTDDPDFEAEAEAAVCCLLLETKTETMSNANTRTWTLSSVSNQASVLSLSSNSGASFERHPVSAK